MVPVEGVFLGLPALATKPGDETNWYITEIRFRRSLQSRKIVICRSNLEQASLCSETGRQVRNRM